MRAQYVRAVRVANRDLDQVIDFGPAGAAALAAHRPRVTGAGSGGLFVFERLEPRITMSGEAGAIVPIEWIASVHDQPFDQPPRALAETEITITEQQRVLVGGRIIDWTGQHTAVQTVSLLRDGQLLTETVSNYTTPLWSERWSYFGEKLDGDAVYVARIEVVRSDGARGAAEIVINVVNTAPYLDTSGPTVAIAGRSFDLLVHPPLAGELPNRYQIRRDAEEDYRAGMTYEVDWDGNGTVDETIRQNAVDRWGPSNAVQRLTHAYASAGIYAVRITARDKDGAVSDVATHWITVSGETGQPADWVAEGKGDYYRWYPSNGSGVAMHDIDGGSLHDGNDEGLDSADADDEQDDLLATSSSDELVSR